jgi:hypothetical protein
VSESHPLDDHSGAYSGSGAAPGELAQLVQDITVEPVEVLAGSQALASNSRTRHRTDLTTEKTVMDGSSGLVAGLVGSCLVRSGG